MKMTKKYLTQWLLYGALSLGLIGCASPSITDYASEKPSLDLKEYFNGHITAHGIFTDRSGKVVRRFVVDMRCSWQGDKGVLDEYFTYSDGKKDRRTWQLEKGADGHYTGTAADVIGTAKGQSAGNAFQWAYTLALPVDGSTYHVKFDDWMYLMDDQVLLNKAVMSKWGFKLGEVTLSFYKSPSNQ
jgi:hypothetical protein